MVVGTEAGLAAVGSATVATLSQSSGIERPFFAMRRRFNAEGGLLECCLQRRSPRRLLERDPFQCSVEWRVERLLLYLQCLLSLRDEDIYRLNFAVVGCCT